MGCKVPMDGSSQESSISHNVTKKRSNGQRCPEGSGSLRDKFPFITGIVPAGSGQPPIRDAMDRFKYGTENSFWSLRFYRSQAKSLGPFTEGGTYKRYKMCLGEPL